MIIGAGKISEAFSGEPQEDNAGQGQFWVLLEKRVEQGRKYCT